MNDGLFPPTLEERLNYLEAFAKAERGHRQHMLATRPAQAEYWLSRVADADEALRHIEQLRGALGQGGV